MSGRRLLALLVILAAIGIPAGVLRAVCAGSSCADGGSAGRVPFCPLPAKLKDAIVNGYREGRSPDVLAVTRGDTVSSPIAGALNTPWPATGTPLSTGVPIVFTGTGVTRDAAVPDGTTLDAVASTIAEVLGFGRPFPNVRSGAAVDGVANGERPRLLLEVAWKGVGTETLEGDPESWRFLASLLDSGAGTLEGDTGSLPLDPAATLTTIGTGGLPSQHGITGTFVRNDAGEVVRAFGEGTPVTVIATLPDDLDEANGNRSLIGLVASDEADRGIVGGDWYPGHDRDDVAIASGGAAVAEAERLLGTGFGADDVPDVLAVVLDGPVPSMDGRTEALVRAAELAAGGSVIVVVAGTGVAEQPAGTGPALASLLRQVEDAIPGEAPVVAATVPGGLFLDQLALTREGITGQVVVDALIDVTSSDGRQMMADAFQGFAVSFARYC